MTYFADDSLKANPVEVWLLGLKKKSGKNDEVRITTVVLSLHQ